MIEKTPLYDSHVHSGGKLVEFAGWHLPIHYGSLINEHHQVRSSAGMFDVSHMTIVDVSGPGAPRFVAHLLCNDSGKLTKRGSALYSCMLNEQGGVIDDLIVYALERDLFRIVVNAATREKDLAWMASIAGDFDVAIDERSQLAMVAVQGPEARDLCESVFAGSIASAAAALNRFQGCRVQDWFVARTGYTGEDGYEVAMPAEQAPAFWDRMCAVGVNPCGLGARDTLRLEAGMHLYGTDMDETQTPLTSGLTWTVAWDPAERDFVGRAALERQRQDGVSHRLTGGLLNGKGVLRGGQVLYSGERRVGVVTSGTFSPTLQKSIGFVRIEVDCEELCEVDIRGRRLPLKLVSRVFVRNGKAVEYPAEREF